MCLHGGVCLVVGGAHCLMIDCWLIVNNVQGIRPKEPNAAPGWLITRRRGLRDAEIATSEPVSHAKRLAGSLLVRYLTRAVHLPVPSLIPRRVTTRALMQIDTTAVEALELVRNTRDGGRHDSVLGVIDKTLTQAGRRLLMRRLVNPLTSLSVIQARLDAIEQLIRDPHSLDNIRRLLKELPDVARSVQRLDYVRDP